LVPTTERLKWSGSEKIGRHVDLCSILQNHEMCAFLNNFGEGIDVTSDVGDTWRYTQSLTLKRTFRGFFYIFPLPYLCLHTVCLVRMEVMWVCFDVLFCISEFHFLFLFIFILFWLACIYLCCWCFPLGVYFNVCLFAYLFRLYSLFVFIYCLLCDCTLYHFFFESISCSKTRLLYSVYWLIVYLVFLKISGNIICII